MTTLDDELDEISDRIRSWREERGISRQELAELSGVATSTVHKVETRQMTPSIAVVLKLAHGLGRRPAEIIAEAEPEPSVAIRRSDDHPATTTGSGRYVRLSAYLVGGEMEIWRVTLQPGVGSGSRLRFDGEVFIACERGAVALDVGGGRHTLATGDTAHFTATNAFSYGNEGERPNRFLLAATLPPELRSVLGAQATEI